MSNGKELWIFTLRFPFGQQESYIASELRVLARHFDHIRLLPLFPENGARELPPNVSTHALFHEDHNEPLPLVPTLLEGPRLFKAYRTTMASAPDDAIRRKYRREVLSRLRQALRREHVLRERLGAAYDPERTVLYSYWSSDWATVLALWRMRDPRVRFVSRMHGFDMYDHRAPDGWQMFQELHVRNAAHFHLVARSGLEHMLDRHPWAGNKFSLSPLATEDHGPAPWGPDPVLRVVSCSNLIPLKRVHLIAEALALLDRPVRWLHFGDGPERGRVEEVVRRLPTNVSVELAGLTPNAAILARYRREPFDVFVHMSSTEGGAPVAMQEAISFGVPLIGTDAGGTRDVLTERTGITLANDATASQLAEELERFTLSDRYTTKARHDVRAFWAQHFDAAVVHERFARALAAH